MEHQVEYIPRMASGTINFPSTAILKIEYIEAVAVVVVLLYLQARLRVWIRAIIRASSVQRSSIPCRLMTLAHPCTLFTILDEELKRFPPLQMDYSIKLGGACLSDSLSSVAPRRAVVVCQLLGWVELKTLFYGRAIEVVENVEDI